VGMKMAARIGMVDWLEVACIMNHWKEFFKCGFGFSCFASSDYRTGWWRLTQR
jgi:hypothetical protein